MKSVFNKILAIAFILVASFVFLTKWLESNLMAPEGVVILNKVERAFENDPVITDWKIKENKYSRGKIYKLVPKIINENEEQLIYIGSTTEKYLSNRLGKHKSQYKLYKIAKIKNKYTSYKLFDKYSIDNVDIILILEYPC
jgi:hypothetical protein